MRQLWAELSVMKENSIWSGNVIMDTLFNACLINKKEKRKSHFGSSASISLTGCALPQWWHPLGGQVPPFLTETTILPLASWLAPRSNAYLTERVTLRALKIKPRHFTSADGQILREKLVHGCKKWESKWKLQDDRVVPTLGGPPAKQHWCTLLFCFFVVIVFIARNQKATHKKFGKYECIMCPLFYFFLSQGIDYDLYLLPSWDVHCSCA